jgi:hypothetical protein
MNLVQLPCAVRAANPGLMKVLQGKVVSGIGDRTQWVVMYADVYEECTHVRLRSGSLNVVLNAVVPAPVSDPHAIGAGGLR